MHPARRGVEIFRNPFTAVWTSEYTKEWTSSLSTHSHHTVVRMPRRRPSCLVCKEKEVSRPMVIVAPDHLVVPFLLRSAREPLKVEVALLQGGLLLLLQKIPDQIFITPRLRRLVRHMLSLIQKPLFLRRQLHILDGIASRILSLAVYTRMILDCPQASTVRSYRRVQL